MSYSGLPARAARAAAHADGRSAAAVPARACRNWKEGYPKGGERPGQAGYQQEAQHLAARIDCTLFTRFFYICCPFWVFVCKKKPFFCVCRGPGAVKEENTSRNTETNSKINFIFVTCRSRLICKKSRVTERHNRGAKRKLKSHQAQKKRRFARSLGARLQLSRCAAK